MMFEKIFNKFEESLLSFLLVSMTVLVFSEVVAIYVFNHGISWAGELTLIMNSWMVLLGASYCVREKAHICVEFLTDRLHGKTAKTVVTVAIISCLIYCAIFLYGSWIFLVQEKIIDIELDDLPIKTWIPASVLLIGFLLLMLRFIQALYRVIFENNLNVLQHSGEVDDSMELARNIKSEEGNKV